MHIQPVTTYRSPQYPTRLQLAEKPDLLRVLPARWKIRAVMAVVGLSGTALGTFRSAQTAEETVPQKLPVVARVAPLFPLAEGYRGELAMLTPSIPFIIPEMEARAIIEDEAKKAGITFTPDAAAVEIPLPVISKQQNGTSVRSIRKTTVTLDGTDMTRKISYEFISAEDKATWFPNMPLRWKADDGVGIDPVEDFRNGLTQAAPAGTVAVFYNPIIGHSPERLREQVREFVVWLKAEGVI